MPTPKGGYFIDKVKIPSVTTIIGRFKDSGALIRWAHKKGLDGEPLYGEGSTSKLACDVGTAAHDMVEAAIRGKKFDEDDYPDDILEAAEKAYGAYARWAAQCKLKPGKTEIGLVSHLHRYGGTLDAVTVEGELRLLDWKTSNSVYADYLLQLAAYGQLWNENFPDEPIKGYDLVRFSKTTGDFAHYSFEDLSAELEQFLLYRRAWDLDQKLRKRV
jgi:hypothetical protein